MNILSDHAFHWFLMLVTGVVAGVWCVYDAISLWRSRGADRRDPQLRDRQFGYVMGMVIGALGVIGVLKFHGVI
jgi:hypothetical protein